LSRVEYLHTVDSLFSLPSRRLPITVPELLSTPLMVPTKVGRDASVVIITCSTPHHDYHMIIVDSAPRFISEVCLSCLCAILTSLFHVASAPINNF